MATKKTTAGRSKKASKKVAKKSSKTVRAKPKKASKARRKSWKIEGNPLAIGAAAVLAIGVIGAVWGLRKHSPAAQAPISVESESADAGTPAVAKGYLGKEFAHASKLAIGERIAFWADYVAAHAPKIARLGKGHAVDDSAPVIPSNFNCTTYVETVASLARSRSADQFFPNLVSIRYRDAKPTFGNRNHFPEADWIPNNQKAGILTDITAQVAESAGVSAKYETKLIDRAAWIASQSEAKARGLASSDPYWSKSTHAKIAYIDVADLPKVVDKIPNGTVLNLVHKNTENRPVLISHQGYVVREGNEVFFRHATSVGHLKKMNLLDYLARRKREGKSLIGVNLDQIHG